MLMEGKATLARDEPQNRASAAGGEEDRARPCELGVVLTRAGEFDGVLLSLEFMPLSPIAQLRKICLALPEAHEVEAWGEPTFRVKNKLFAMYADSSNHHGGGRPGAWIKSTHVNQDLLVHSDPDRYFKPPYVGPSGWVGVYLDKRPPWSIVSDLIRDGYLLTAPKKIAAALTTQAGKK